MESKDPSASSWGRLWRQRRRAKRKSYPHWNPCNQRNFRPSPRLKTLLCQTRGTACQCGATCGALLAYEWGPAARHARIASAGRTLRDETACLGVGGRDMFALMAPIEATDHRLAVMLVYRVARLEEWERARGPLSNPDGARRCRAAPIASVPRGVMRSIRHWRAAAVEARA